MFEINGDMCCWKYATEKFFSIKYLRENKVVGAMFLLYIFIHHTGSNINNYNNRKLNYKHFIKYYELLQKLAKTIYCRNISWYKLILPSLKNTARQINSKAALAIFYYINSVLKRFKASKGEVWRSV